MSFAKGIAPGTFAKRAARSIPAGFVAYLNNGGNPRIALPHQAMDDINGGDGEVIAAFRSAADCVAFVDLKNAALAKKEN